MTTDNWQEHVVLRGLQGDPPDLTEFIESKCNPAIGDVIVALKQMSGAQHVTAKLVLRVENDGVSRAGDVYFGESGTMVNRDALSVTLESILRWSQSRRP